MSYSKGLEDFILQLKGEVFFLSPREKIFLKHLEEMGIPERVVREGIEECYTAINPKRRGKRPLFLCFKTIMEKYENYLRFQAQKLEIDWKERFRKKIEKVRDMIRGEIREPRSEEEAQEILKDIENRILRNLWRRLPREEKEEIREKFKEFKENRWLFGELIKSELKKRFGIPDLSLYID